MYVGSGERVRVLGVFVCWLALVRVTSQTAAPATTAASLKLFRGSPVLFPKQKVIFYFTAVISRTFSENCI